MFTVLKSEQKINLKILNKSYFYPYISQLNSRYYSCVLPDIGDIKRDKLLNANVKSKKSSTVLILALAHDTFNINFNSRSTIVITVKLRNVSV